MLQDVVTHTTKNRYLYAQSKLIQGKRLTKAQAEAYLLQLMRFCDCANRDPVIGYVELDTDYKNRNHVQYEWLHTSKRTAMFLAAAAEYAGGRVVERVQEIVVSIDDEGTVAYVPMDGWTARKVYKVVIAW